eukprot:3291801-Alexandrium_andersonii.AAC.1
MRRELIARVLVVHWAESSELGETLGLMRHGRVHHRGSTCIAPEPSGLQLRAGADAVLAEPRGP